MNSLKRLLLKYLPTYIVRLLMRTGEAGVYECEGVRLLLNRYSYCESALLNGSGFPRTWHLIADSVCRGDNVVDVGANVGVVSLLCARNLQGEGRVFAFEPDPYVFRRLCRNIDLNKMGDVVLPVPVALSDRIGRLPFASVIWGNLGEGTLETGVTHISEKLKAGRMRRELADVTTLDCWCAQYGVDRLDIVKIDVEGHELSVLRGMKEMVVKSPALRVFVDCHQDMGVDIQDIFQLLSEWGMKIVGLAVSDGGMHVVQPTDTSFRDAPCIAAYGPLAIPEELRGL